MKYLVKTKRKAIGIQHILRVCSVRVYNCDGITCSSSYNVLGTLFILSF